MAGGGLYTQTMKVQVVILNWNGEQFLRRFLPRVVATCAPSGAEVVVADNGSTDGSEGVVRGDFPSVRWIALGENYGFAEGYNRALAGLDGELFVLLNSDVEPAEGWLEPLIERMATDPLLAAIQPKILSYATPTMFEYAGAAGGFIDRFGYPFCRGRIMGTIERDNGQWNDSREVFWASGAAMMISAEAWHKAGGLDGDFFAHMEEIDLCWRLQLMGYHIGVEPRSVVYHVGGGTLPNNSPRKIYLNFRNSLSMLTKCLPEGEGWRLVVRRAMDLLSWGVYVLTGKWSFAGAVVRAHRDWRAMRSELQRKRAELWSKGITNPKPDTIYRGWIVGRYALGRKRFKGIDL